MLPFLCTKYNHENSMKANTNLTTLIIAKQIAEKYNFYDLLLVLTHMILKPLNDNLFSVSD